MIAASVGRAARMARRLGQRRRVVAVRRRRLPGDGARLQARRLRPRDAAAREAFAARAPRASRSAPCWSPRLRHRLPGLVGRALHLGELRLQRHRQQHGGDPDVDPAAELRRRRGALRAGGARRMCLVLRGGRPDLRDAASKSGTRAAISPRTSEVRSRCRVGGGTMSLIAIGGLLLFILLLLLTGGVWIAMALAIVGWVGQSFFTTTPPGKNLFSAFWETTASWELAALPLFIWMGEILFRTQLSEQMFERPGAVAQPRARAADAHHDPRLRHLRLGLGLVGRDLRHDRQGGAARTEAARLRRASWRIGALATAGRLGILIPPSITMVVYAVAADASRDPPLPRRLPARLPADGAVLAATSPGGACATPTGAAARAADHAGCRSCAARRSLIPCGAADRLHRLGAGRRLGHRHRMRGLRRARLAGHRRGRRASLTWRNFWDGPDGRHARELHDHVHPGRRRVPDQDDGLHRHPARAGRMGGGDAPAARTR